MQSNWTWYSSLDSNAETNYFLTWTPPPSSFCDTDYDRPSRAAVSVAQIHLLLPFCCDRFEAAPCLNRISSFSFLVLVSSQLESDLNSNGLNQIQLSWWNPSRNPNASHRNPKDPSKTWWAETVYVLNFRNLVLTHEYEWSEELQCYVVSKYSTWWWQKEATLDFSSCCYWIVEDTDQEFPPPAIHEFISTTDWYPDSENASRT